jgi:hypothetical protein
METFYATIEQFYKKTEKTTCPMVLLSHVCTSNGDLFRDHTWVKTSNRFANFKKGDRISFTARIEPYLSIGGTKQGLRHLRNLSLA